MFRVAPTRVVPHGITTVIKNPPSTSYLQSFVTQQVLVRVEAVNIFTAPLYFYLEVILSILSPRKGRVVLTSPSWLMWCLNNVLSL